jgi:hypothetical protein
MKKFLMVVLALSISALASASWSDYRSASTEARRYLSQLQAETNTATALSSLEGVVAACEATAVEAKKLGRPDIASWAYNNAAYANIVAFKKACNYTSMNTKIESLDPKCEDRKILLRQLQDLYRTNLHLLDSADKYLESASALSSVSAAKVESNRGFISDVRKFIEITF